MVALHAKSIGKWADYSEDEHKTLQLASMTCPRNEKFYIRPRDNDLSEMLQNSKDSGIAREIRQLKRRKASSKSLLPAGPSTVINVPQGSPASSIRRTHSRLKGPFISGKASASARPWQALLVPVPEDAVATASIPTRLSADHGSWSTGAKVAAGKAGDVSVAAAAVSGATIGEHIADHGLDATIDTLGGAMSTLQRCPSMLQWMHETMRWIQHGMWDILFWTCLTQAPMHT
jgi:hypothetical protein